MNVELPYADGTLTATLPAGTQRLSVEAESTIPALPDLAAAVRAALASPLGLPRIRELVKPRARVTIAFDNHTTGSFGPIRPVAIRELASRPRRSGWCAPTRCIACVGRPS